MKIAFFDLKEWEVASVKQRCKDTGLDIICASTDPLDIANVSQAKDADVLCVFLSKIDQPIIEALPSLKLISTRATGVDHIDIEHAKKKKIAVTNVPSYAERTVAEYAMGLIFVLSRRLGETLKQSSRGIFDQKTVCGNDLAGKTLGVVGTGKIGCKLVRMASGFDMKILCYDLVPQQELCQACGAEYASRETLLKNSDIISIHLPYTKDTHHFINLDTLKILKRGVLLVNTARGSIVDLAALRQGLEDEIFGGVALDTFEGENIWIEQQSIVSEKIKLPPAKNFKEALEAFYLQRFKNVILTPHVAFNSCEAVQRMMETALTDITTFFQKGDCSNRII